MYVVLPPIESDRLCQIMLWRQTESPASQMWSLQPVITSCYSSVYTVFTLGSLSLQHCPAHGSEDVENSKLALTQHTSLSLTSRWLKQVTWITGIKWDRDVQTLTGRVTGRYDKIVI